MTTTISRETKAAPSKDPVAAVNVMIEGYNLIDSLVRIRREGTISEANRLRLESLLAARKAFAQRIRATFKVVQ